MMENRPPLTSPDGSSNGNPPERCPYTLYSQDSRQEDHTIPHHHQGEELKGIKVKVKVEKEEMFGEQQSMEERGPPYSRDSTQEDHTIPHHHRMDVMSRIPLRDIFYYLLIIDPSNPEESSSPHEGAHQDQNLFSCSECGKCFPWKGKCIQHQRVHTSERTFPCSECSKCFKHKHNLVTHQRIHT
ncbi:hypothetical protein AB205_0182600, partial [Aquarana catesbeiana]